MKSRSAALMALLALILGACSSAATSAPGVGGSAGALSGSLTIYAAASLKAALTRAQTAFTTANAGVTIVVSTDSSSALETQIEQGAPADLLLSADASNPARLVTKGLADGAPVDFAGNLLTVIVPAANPAGIQTPADLARSGLKVIAAGDSVPITKYASTLVANLAKEPGYPAGFVTKYDANIASKEDNVAAVVSKIALGEGDAAIVYVTDAKTSTQVTAIAVPADANVPAVYAGIVVKASHNREAAQAFLTWLAGPDGQAILGSFDSCRRPESPALCDPARPGVPRPRHRGLLHQYSLGMERVDSSPTGIAGEQPPASARSGGAGLLGLAIVLGSAIGLPVLVIVGRALLGGSLVATLGQPVILDALALSLASTAACLLITVLIGLPLAFVLARRSFPGRSILEAVIDLPIVLPPSVAGLALLLTLGREGLVGRPLSALGIELPFTTVAVVLAQTFVSAPFFIRSARLGFASVDRHLEDAARCDGASELQLFRAITIPLAGSALAAGLVMSWARSLGEFGATIMFAGNVEGRTQTLPLVVYSQFQGGDLDGSIAAAAILVLAAFGVLVAVRVLHWGRVLDLRSLS